MTRVFKIDQEMVDEIVAHARRDAPFEACGMIGGTGDTAERVYPCGNPDASSLTYTIDPQEAFSVVRAMRDEGQEFIACYHSHPATEAYPSPTDRAKAAGPGFVYLIASLREPGKPVIRAFSVGAETVTELDLVVVKRPD